MKYLINEAVINVKIPIKVDDYLKEFIFKNINMRRQIWNDFVEEANKYGCNYYKAPSHTTCTCYKCNHINPHLPLTQRVFKCEKCGYTIDRDMNASKNCYDFIS